MYYLTDANDNVTGVVTYSSTSGIWQVTAHYVYNTYRHGDGLQQFLVLDWLGTDRNRHVPRQHARLRQHVVQSGHGPVLRQRPLVQHCDKHVHRQE